ncbi:MAG: NADPH:quinone reductase-like Zn-dependent oxidoreductase [Kiritimatiellia bacterium]
MSRVIVARKRGAPDVLVLERREVGEAGTGQTKIRVRAAGVAFGDVMRRRGLLTGPGALTPGYDLVGEAVSGDLDPGTRVAVLMPSLGHGGYAEHVVVNTDRLVRVPDEVDDVTAVALGLNYITALQLLTRLTEPAPGDVVLIHGASGGVGTALLELAKLRGVTTYGTASEGKRQVVIDRGGTHIDYRTQDFVRVMKTATPEGVTAVYDSVGGDNFARSLSVVRRGGTLVNYGATAHSGGGWTGFLRSQIPFACAKLSPFGPRVKVYAITMSAGCGWEACRDDWSTLLQMAAQGKVNPLVGATVPLEYAARAHQMLEERLVAGKIVLTV